MRAYAPTDFGFVAAGARDLGDGNVVWHAEMMMIPFHKIIPSNPLAAHIWAPMDDENTMLYSINFDPDAAPSERGKLTPTNKLEKKPVRLVFRQPQHRSGREWKILLVGGKAIINGVSHD